MLRLIAAILVTGALCLSTVYAEPSVGKNVDKKEAVAIAKEAENGKVLKISEQKDKFIVRILKPKGRVIDIIVSKRTGQVEKENN